MAADGLGAVDDGADHRAGGDVERGVDELAGFVVLAFEDAAGGEVEGEQGAALGVGRRAVVEGPADELGGRAGGRGAGGRRSR